MKAVEVGMAYFLGPGRMTESPEDSMRMTERGIVDKREIRLFIGVQSSICSRGMRN